MSLGALASSVLRDIYQIPVPNQEEQDLGQRSADFGNVLTAPHF
jgi:hypothetical protein